MTQKEEYVGITNSASDWVEKMWNNIEPNDSRLKQAIEDACDGFDPLHSLQLLYMKAKPI